MPRDVVNTWNERAKALVGKKIAEARYLTDEEVENLGWDEKVIVLIFDDGSYVFPSRDDEGNGGGALFASSDELEFPVIRTY